MDAFLSAAQPFLPVFCFPLATLATFRPPVSSGRSNRLLRRCFQPLFPLNYSPFGTAIILFSSSRLFPFVLALSISSSLTSLLRTFSCSLIFPVFLFTPRHSLSLSFSLFSSLAHHPSLLFRFWRVVDRSLAHFYLCNG